MIYFSLILNEHYECTAFYVRAGKKMLYGPFNQNSLKSAICTDNLSCFLYEADPQYVWQVVDVHGRDAFCLQETVFGFRSYGMEKYFLQPFGFKVRVGFTLLVG